jgi:C-methyltransferase-like protein/putative zinc binding protein/methyltransferase family protein
MTRLIHCRSCGSSSLHLILDLGLQPLANALVEPSNVGQPEDKFPLEVIFCESCSLVQVSETIPPEVLFGRDYPYFSSFLPELLEHSRHHALALLQTYALGRDSLVVEVASNDGYLLKNFLAAGVPVLGIDPAQGPAQAARDIGVETLQAFFGADTANQLVAEGKRADVMLANNVLAHVENINAFVAGFAILLADDGVAEFEFPYLRDLIDAGAFDTIYHEHVFYYSLRALDPLFERHGLHLNDVQRIGIHGGSLRLTVGRKPGKTSRLEAMMREEAELGMSTLQYYKGFGQRVAELRDELRGLLHGLVAKGERVAAYGAAAKGATLLNFAGIDGDVIDYVVDRNPHKVGRYMPGLRIPVRPVEALATDRPDYLLILAWNFGAEIMTQQCSFAEAGGKFILPIPRAVIVNGPAPQDPRKPVTSV